MNIFFWAEDHRKNNINMYNMSLASISVISYLVCMVIFLVSRSDFMQLNEKCLLVTMESLLMSKDSQLIQKKIKREPRIVLKEYQEQSVCSSIQLNSTNLATNCKLNDGRGLCLSM